MSAGGAQLVNQGFQLLNFGFPLCCALDRTSMPCPPVVGLLTQFDPFQTVDVIRDGRHATMIGNDEKRVQSGPLWFEDDIRPGGTSAVAGPLGGRELSSSRGVTDRDIGVCARP